MYTRAKNGKCCIKRCTFSISVPIVRKYVQKWELSVSIRQENQAAADF